MSTRPVFVLVHGGWFTSTVFAPLISELWKEGFPCWTADLPTSKSDPSKTGQDDIDFLVKSLETLADQGKELIPVVWSYGAWVGGAAIQNVLKSERAKAGKPGGVVGLVYAACVIPPKEGMVAQEIMNAWGGESWYDPALMQESQMGYGPLITIGNPKPIFYNGSPYSDPSSVLNPIVEPFAGGAFATPMPYVPLKEDSKPPVPVAYIHAADDISVPARVQKEVMEKYKLGISQIVEVPGGHLWMVNQPKLAAEGLISFSQKI